MEGGKKPLLVVIYTTKLTPLPPYSKWTQVLVYTWLHQWWLISKQIFQMWSQQRVPRFPHGEFSNLIIEDQYSRKLNHGFYIWTKNSFEIYCDAYLNTDDRFFTKFLVPQNLEWTHLTFQQLLPFINVAMKLFLWRNWRLHDSRMAEKKPRWQNILLIPLQVSKSIDLRVVGGFIYNLSLPLFFILCLIDFPFTIQRWYGIKNKGRVFI